MWKYWKKVSLKKRRGVLHATETFQLCAEQDVESEAANHSRYIKRMAETIRRRREKIGYNVNAEKVYLIMKDQYKD